MHTSKSAFRLYLNRLGTPSITSVGNNFSPVSPTVAVIAGSYAAIINVTGVAGATIRWGLT